MTETITMEYQPKVLCSTAGMTENDWLAWRKTGIGGSEAGIILGSNPYRTKRELFYEKTGVEPVNEKETSTLALRWGHAESFSMKKQVLSLSTKRKQVHLH